MESMCSGRNSRPRSNRHVLRTATVTLPLLLMFGGGTAWAQGVRISGTVSSPGGAPLPGVLVRVLGGADSASTTTTNGTGRYTITAPATGTLSFTLIGFQPYRTPVGGRTTIDATLSRLAVLQEVVVTSGYGGAAQQRSDITGAVASVNIDATKRQTSASVLQRLDATVSGVTVAGNGSPGSRSTVRIRGISSFQNNDPLYIVDGTPVQDSYVNFLNPNDIASIQVLKDASAASIYGSRASNGVIIIETIKRGTQGPPRTTLAVRTGVQTPNRGYDDFLLTNALDYFQVVKQSYLNAGRAVPTGIYGDPNNPTVPQYTYAAAGTFDPKTGLDAFGRPVNVDVSKYSYPNNLIMPGSAGTNWWRAVFGPAPISDVNLNVSGAGTGAAYAVSGNYFDQSGTAAYNRFRRGSVRANTSFTRGRFTVGENVSVIGEGAVGGLGDDSYGEGGILGKNILSQPVVPIYDVNGNFASGKANGLGNNTNPLKSAYAARNNTVNTRRAFGNVFAQYDVTPRIALRTTFGGNAGQQAYRQYTAATPENSEATFNDGFLENNRNFTDYTWSNTARYSRSGDRHNVSLLLGQEINRSNFRFLQGGVNNLVSNNINSQYIQPALGTLSTPFSNGGRSALLSFFGKADYTFNDRYVASVTVRRDGSSNLGPGNQWGTFPAVGLAWKASREAFLQNNRVISDLQFRVGYGVTGNQQIPSGRIVSQFGGDQGATYYDITGSGNKLAVGYKLVSLGNPNLRWEENRSINGGVDLSLFDNRVTVIADVYNRVTNNLLFNPALPATAGTAAAPIVNIGAIRNRGIDFSIGHAGPSWSLTFNGSSYRNQITRIDGVQDFFYSPAGTRISNQLVINKIGQPIGSFYGYQADGYFQSQAEIDALNAATRARPGAAATAQYQDGAAPGRIKFRDINGDGTVTLADRTVIGNPQPKFTGGLDGQVRRGRFDLGATLFGTFGNKIFDAQKNFYIFRDFDTNVRRDLLANSWRPDNPNAKYPRLDVSDTFSRQPSSYYVESGAYVRLRSLQLGYTVASLGRRVLPAGTRVYLQGENLFTLTGYSGLDPSLPPTNLTGAAGDIRDQFRGVDQGVYPTSRTFGIGFNTSF